MLILDMLITGVVWRRKVDVQYIVDFRYKHTIFNIGTSIHPFVPTVCLSRELTAVSTPASSVERIVHLKSVQHQV